MYYGKKIPELLYQNPDEWLRSSGAAEQGEREIFFSPKSFLNVKFLGGILFSFHPVILLFIIVNGFSGIHVRSFRVLLVFPIWSVCHFPFVTLRGQQLELLDVLVEESLVFLCL